MSVANIPVVETERLTLRAFVDADLDEYARWHADPETMRYVGGKALSREDAWRSLAMMSGHWLLRGYGMWAVVDKATGALVGRVGLWMPEGWPSIEVGWMVAPAARRRGFAAEAARASIAYARNALGIERVISIIHVDNAPSIAVAKSIGETFREQRTIRGFPCGVWERATSERP